MRPAFEFGFLGAYNNYRGVIPFERFFLGGDGMGMYNLDGRENIPLRGYPNQSLSAQDGGSIYNKYSLELRYPISLGEQAKIFALSFIEGGSSYNSFRDFDPFLLINFTPLYSLGLCEAEIIIPKSWLNSLIKIGIEPEGKTP